MTLQAELTEILSEDRVLMRYIDRIAWANDASVYRLVPRAVVQPQSLDEIRELFRFSRSHRIPLTFRAAGTSLSGQAITDGILVVVSRHWREIEVLDDGARVRVQPGAIGGMVNEHLRPHGRKIGPDPASINACMMGGILSNNSSGMCCGVVQNAYHTLESMRYVLPDGLYVDSSLADADERLRRERPDLAEGLLDLKRRIESDTALRDKIRTKYQMKNTTGYSLNAFLDYERSVDILTQLMIGSEGTLGFIAEAVLKTVPDDPHKYTGMLFFPDVPRACTAIEPLRDSGARALELMDRASLRAAQDQPGVPPGMAGLPPQAAAILVEYQCPTVEELDARRRGCDVLVPELPLIAEPDFTRDPERQAALWTVRKGLIPSVGAMRRRGTSFIIEDVVFPVERLADGVTDLQELFARHGYDDAILFGHAKDGNLHFVLTQAFDRAEDVTRYDAFMQDLAVVVAGRYGGALKAEHGTGRNMAPFVAAEWGDHARRLMVELKRLVDPDGMLNPGVILNDDPRAHVHHLKELPTVEAEVDRCIECGFCERMCPSRDLTLTPRQRIVVRREMTRLRESGSAPALLRELQDDYVHEAIDSCAADGLCATACPVAIDTGQLVKRLRRESHSPVRHELVRLMAEKFGLVERTTRAALRAGHTASRWLGDDTLQRLTRGVSRILGNGFPVWQSDVPAPATGELPATDRTAAVAVYFPSCVTRIGADPENGSLPERMVAVARRARRPLWIPPEVAGHCCGMPFGSKGYADAHRQALERTVTDLWTWSDGGRLPVVVDASPCAYTLKQAAADLPSRLHARFEQLRILDSIEFAEAWVVPGLSLQPRDGAVVLHPVCSARKMGLAGGLQRIARACVRSATVPIHAGCCGFAGDRGFSLPELTRAATRAEAREIESGAFDGYYSSSPTCEIGLRRATGKPFRSFWHLLDEASRRGDADPSNEICE